MRSEVCSMGEGETVGSEARGDGHDPTSFRVASGPTGFADEEASADERADLGAVGGNSRGRMAAGSWWPPLLRGGHHEPVAPIYLPENARLSGCKGVRQSRSSRENSRPGVARSGYTRCQKRGLQLPKGLPNDSVPMRRKYFTSARDSVCEVVAAIDLAVELGAVDIELADPIAELAVRVRAPLIGLLR